MLLVWSSGPLQEPVPKQTAGETIEPRENDQGRRWYRNTCCGSSVGYGSSSRAARRAAEGSTPGVLVFSSSSRQEAKPRETFDKATYAQREKAASLLARTTARETSNQRSCKVLPTR
ncbi:hypothetical protein MTO96_052221 [Rhipicephalus appendiculatus]